MGDATLDWNAATADAAPVTRGRSCGGTSEVAVRGVDGRSDCAFWVGIDEIGEPSDLELGEGLAIDARLKKVRKDVRVSKGIVRGFTRNKDLHSRIGDIIQKVSQCARPENTTIHIRREFGENANQGVEGEARDLQEVRIWRTDEVKQCAEFSLGHQSGLQGCNDGLVRETSQGGAGSIKLALP